MTRPLTLLAALAIEGSAGYPDWLFRRLGHPVSWAGAVLAGLERRLNDPALPPAARRRRGEASLLILLGAGVTAARLAPRGTRTLLAASLLAGRSLHDHVAAVLAPLEAGDLDGARVALSRIVGRDTEHLDRHAIARAAIESLAENFSDAVVAPALFFLAGGLPAIALYKAANTADSMIGHRSARFEAFGRAAARLDDLLNLPASRLSALLVALASPHPARSLGAVRRSARHHRSPNAGWPEAAMAGALGLRLNGPRAYGGVPTTDAWMGDGRADAEPADLRRALALYRRALALGALLVTIRAASPPSSSPGRSAATRRGAARARSPSR